MNKSLIKAIEFSILTALLMTYTECSQKGKKDYDMGMAMSSLKDYEQAIASFDKAIEANPGYVMAYYNRALAKEGLRNYKGAIGDFEKAIKMKPRFTDAIYGKGLAMEILEDYKGAIAEYDKVVKLDPGFSYINYNRGRAKIYLSDYNGAMDDLSKAIDLGPDIMGAFIEQAYYFRGIAKLNLQDYKGAIADLTRYMAYDHRDAKAYYNRGMALYSTRDFNKAIEDFNGSIELNRGEADVLKGGLTMMDKKEIESAVNELDLIYAKAYYYRGLSKIESGQKESGCEDLKKAAGLGSAEAREAMSVHCK